MKTNIQRIRAEREGREKSQWRLKNSKKVKTIAKVVMIGNSKHRKLITLDQFLISKISQVGPNYKSRNKKRN